MNPLTRKIGMLNEHAKLLRVKLSEKPRSHQSYKSEITGRFLCATHSVTWKKVEYKDYTIIIHLFQPE